MSLTILENGWRRFGGGRRWRCTSPRYLCEVDDEGETPSYLGISATVSRLQRVKLFYRGKLSFGVLDEFGTGLDILVANSFTESFGTVPSPLDTKELRREYESCAGDDAGAKLDHVIRYIAGRAKFLERREPGYSTPTATPARVSVGAHHVLIATAVSLMPNSAGDSALQREARITDLVCRLPAESLYAADFAIRYFNRSYGKHRNELPLLAATYNAGSPRFTTKNAWNLVQYGEHIDRWIAYYNTSRLI